MRDIEKEVYENWRKIELQMVAIVRRKRNDYGYQHLDNPTTVITFEEFREHIFQNVQFIDGLRVVYTRSESIFTDEHKIEVI